MTLLFSVAIPAYNCGRYLAETLDSVLGQSLAPAEVVVTDDGSTDDTAEVLAAYAARVRSTRIPNAGPGIARKTAIEACTGDWIALCDGDDVWEPDHLARKAQMHAHFPQANLLLSNFTSIGNVVGDTECHLDEAPPGWLGRFAAGQVGTFHLLPEPFRALLHFNVAYTTGTAFSRALYEAAGGVLPAYSRRLAEDAEFMRRMAAHPLACGAYDSTPCWRYRRHAGNFSTASEYRNLVAGARIIEELAERGFVDEAWRGEVVEVVVARRIGAFMRAYWDRKLTDALQIARDIPGSHKSLGIRLREWHCRFGTLSTCKRGEDGRASGCKP